jgi:hypothetical protein
LRLLPDLKKTADEEHEFAQLKALETEALKKQITAMEEDKKQLEAKAMVADSLANDLQILKAQVDKL